jgi:hypothetical protein
VLDGPIGLRGWLELLITRDDRIGLTRRSEVRPNLVGVMSDQPSYREYL